jgi:hypothetical protein
MAVPVETRAGFVLGKSVRLFDDRYLPAVLGAAACDVSPDGERFVMVRTHGEQVPASALNVVLGWTDELSRRAKAGNETSNR